MLQPILVPRLGNIDGEECRHGGSTLAQRVYAMAIIVEYLSPA
jgi:hypothetical protein